MTDIVERLREAPLQHWQEAADEIVRLTSQRKALAETVERLREQVASLQASSGYETSIAQAALERIEQWSRAYPLTVFPEPDLKKAAVVLKENGMTLDAISAHAMRHVVEGVGKIAREALGGDY